MYITQLFLANMSGGWDLKNTALAQHFIVEIVGSRLSTLHRVLSGNACAIVSCRCELSRS